MMRLTNPFTNLLGRERKDAERQLQEQRDAEQRLQKLLDTYRLILSDARYTMVEQNLQLVREEQVARLITKASTCPQCSPYAERVLLLDDVVSAPRKAVDYAASQSQDGEALQAEMEVEDA